MDGVNILSHQTYAGEKNKYEGIQNPFWVEYHWVYNILSNTALKNKDKFKIATKIVLQFILYFMIYITYQVEYKKSEDVEYEL